MTITKYLFFLLQILSRYFIIAGVFFLLFYVINKSKWSYKKIQQIFPRAKDYRREILNSLFSIGLFALIPALFFKNMELKPYTQLYDEIAEKGWVYYFLAFPIMAFLHDTYFYWIHRLMHHPVLFKWFHLVHHKSTNPSPWAAYAFHPLEAILENGIIILFYFTLPMHVTHVPIFFLFSIIYNIYGHMGWELYPKGFNTTLIGRWVNTAVAHNQHHKFFTGNYGLYLLFWDRMMGTLRADYDAAFDKVKNRKV